MIQERTVSIPPEKTSGKKFALGLWAVFITQFVSILLINARNIAQPGMIAELDGMSLFAWLIALPAMSGAASTLLFGKLSDMFGRRTMLLVSIAIFLVGLVISAYSNTMAFLIASATFMSIGQFPIIPLCFSVIGDLFPPRERARWTGLLNIPTGIAALVGPVLGGLVVESAFGWRGLFWGTIPLMIISGILVAVGLPDIKPQGKPDIDIYGTLIMVVATTTLIFGFSELGVPHKLWLSLVLLTVSIIAWVGFVFVEKRVKAPILDPQVLFNRTFMTAAIAALLSFFGTLGIVAYSPIFVQDVMGISPTLSGSMLTPHSVIVAFMGIPVGFLMAKTKKYKGMYIIGYAIVTAALFMMWRFTAVTPVWTYILITAVAGFGLGAVPTLTTLVAQFSVPKDLLGAAVGAIFFFQMIGIALAPSILGLVQNSVSSLEHGLTLVFLTGAVAMLISLLLIITIPEINMDSE